MDKFSKIIKPKEEETENSNFLFSGSYLKIKDIQGWEAVIEKDCIVALIYLEDTDELLIRKEVVPTFEEVTNQRYFLTILAGGIEENENSLQALKRELKEEAGIELHSFYNRAVKWNQLFVNKGNTSQYHIYYVPLTINEFTWVKANGDGSVVEKNSNCVCVESKLAYHLNPVDTITALCLEYFKTELNNRKDNFINQFGL